MNNLTEEQIARLREYTASIESLYSEYATRDGEAIRLHRSNKSDPLRTQFGTDIDRIINSKFFNRGADKTQVFSFRRNDDITRRSSHVQLVSRVARKIGKALRLNLDLIEAIAIGHDIGHTPFGHAGERILSDLYYSHVGKYFNHNVHSVRVLNLISHNNLTVQTLDGILCHCGEKVDSRYEPNKLPTPEGFLSMFNACYTQKDGIKRLRPATLEGCVVRLSDMIAYIGKDRADAFGVLRTPPKFDNTALGKNNSQIIDTVTTDVIANSMDKPYLSLSDDVYAALETYVRENYEKIYGLPEIREPYDNVIRPMAEKLYEKLLSDLKNGDESSIIFKHYLNGSYVHSNYFPEDGGERIADSPDDMVIDFMASMTDDYFLDAFEHLFPNDPLVGKAPIVGYFSKG